MKKQFTKKELEKLQMMVNAHLVWGAGGCFGDGSIIDDKRGYKSAQKILAKLQEEIFNY